MRELEEENPNGGQNRENRVGGLVLLRGKRQRFEYVNVKSTDIAVMNGRDPRLSFNIFVYFFPSHALP